MANHRFALAGVSLVCLLVCATAIAQTSELPPASAYLHPQSMVPVAPGRRLNLYCTGKGAPTVLFESGLGDGTLVWRALQGKIAATTRVCSYDRANYFYSDTVERAATAQASVDDLLALIDQAHLGDRVILVGHSRGGLNARLFTYEHTDRVAGMVLIDPTITEQLAPATTRNYVHKYENYLKAGEQLRDCQQMAMQQQLRIDRADPLRCLDTFDDHQAPDEKALADATRSMETRPIFQGTLFSEREHLFYPIDDHGDSTDGRSISSTEHSLGDLPLVVIGANWFKSSTFKGKPTAEQEQFLAWHVDQMQRIARESTRGQFVEVGSKHYVQRERPDVVMAAILRVLELARASQSQKEP